MDNSYPYGAPVVNMNMNLGYSQPQQQFFNHNHNHNQNAGYQAMPPPNYSQAPSMGMNQTDSQYSNFQNIGYQSRAIPSCHQVPTVPTMGTNFLWPHQEAGFAATVVAHASKYLQIPASTTPKSHQNQPQNTRVPPTPSALKPRGATLGTRLNAQPSTSVANLGGKIVSSDQKSDRPLYIDPFFLTINSPTSSQPAPVKQPVVVDLTIENENEIEDAGLASPAGESTLASSPPPNSSSSPNEAVSPPKEATPPTSPIPTKPINSATEAAPAKPKSFKRSFGWLQSPTVMPELPNAKRQRLSGPEGDFRARYEIRASNSTASYFLGIKPVAPAPVTSWEEHASMHGLSKRCRKAKGDAGENGAGKRKRDTDPEKGGRAPKKAKRAGQPKAKMEVAKERMTQKKELWRKGEVDEQGSEERDAEGEEVEEENVVPAEEDDEEDFIGAALDAQFAQEAEEQEKKDAEERKKEGAKKDEKEKQNKEEQREQKGEKRHDDIDDLFDDSDDETTDEWEGGGKVAGEEQVGKEKEEKVQTVKDKEREADDLDDLFDDSDEETTNQQEGGEEEQPWIDSGELEIIDDRPKIERYKINVNAFRR